MEYKNPDSLIDENGKYQILMQLHKGSSTTVQSYQPSEEEKALMRQQYDYANYIMPNAKSLNDSAANMFFDSLGDMQVDYKPLLAQAQAQNASANTGRADLANGVLPSAYLQNMTDAISSGVNSTVGSAINNLAARGIVNSSTSNKALSDISKNVSDTVAQSYLNNISALQGIYNDQQANAGNAISLGAAGQEAAQSPAMNAWNMSLGLGGNTNQALSTIAGKMGTSTSTQSTSGGGLGGGLVSGLLGLGSSLIASCFTDDTQIDMADGTQKKISNIHIGDRVFSYNTDTGERVAESVVALAEPRYAMTYAVVCLGDKNAKRAVYTTPTQPLLTEDGEFVDVGLMRLGTRLKGVGKVTGIVESGERKVYDFKTENNNTYYANGFIAYGMFEGE